MCGKEAPDTMKDENREVAGQTVAVLLFPLISLFSLKLTEF